MTCSTRFGAAVALAAAGAAWGQTGTLDQSSPRSNASYNESTPSLLWQAQIRAGIAGRLEGIKLTLAGAVGATMTLNIRMGAAPSSNPVLFSTHVTRTTAGQEEQFINMTSANIPLAVNDVYVMETFGDGSGMNLVGSYVDPAMGPPLYPEPLYLNRSNFVPGWRHGFDTYMLTGGVCYANCDGSTIAPVLTVNDFVCFQSSFAAGNSYANCDGSSVPPLLTINDFVCFQSRFAAGCP